MKEKVLVIPSDTVRSFEEGLIEISEEVATNLIESGFFVSRSEAETNEEWRQVIPYVAFLDGEKILLVKRTENQSEKRLHNLYSIGIGGHVNETDGKDPLLAFKNGLNREINEEIDVDIHRLKFIGLINDLSKEVSRVHIGFFYIAEAKVKGIREKENFEWRMIDLMDLEKFEEGMENWSKIASNWLKSNLLRS